MVANWLKILLFAAGGSTAAAGTVYYTGIYDPWAVEETTTPMAAAEPAGTGSAAPGPASGEPESQAAPETDGSAAAVDGTSAAGEATPEIAAVEAPETGTQDGRDLVVPSFDIVRVEPDGSMVIAGSAEPNSKIEVVAGAEVIARADVGPAGDFAAVLDDALRPGDYQIVLRSTGPAEGFVTTSQETAIVSVPEDSQGDVLALVEQPGAPSRLITVPEGQAADAPSGEPEPAEMVAAEALPNVADVDVAVQPGATPGSDEASASAEAGTANGETPAPEAEAEARSQTESAPTQNRPASPRNALAVEAIEIERGTVFVAGRGAAGSTVRVYANEMLLGEARVSEGGRFLIESQTDLPVGDYIVRADVIGASGDVTARAAVPFQREPGEAVAAVARPATEPEAAGSDAGNSASQSEATSQNATGQSGTTTEAPGQGAVADTDANPASGQSAAGAPAIEETMAAPLQAADGAVIIRRGDTLWRISRRVYGRGVRYSTIYLANQEQIRDPDMIWPGQIFAVPDETEQGEKADMSTVSDQLAPAKATQ